MFFLEKREQGLCQLGCLRVFERYLRTGCSSAWHVKVTQLNVLDAIELFWTMRKENTGSRETARSGEAGRDKTYLRRRLSCTMHSTLSQRQFPQGAPSTTSQRTLRALQETHALAARRLVALGAPFGSVANDDLFLDCEEVAVADGFVAAVLESCGEGEPAAADVAGDEGVDSDSLDAIVILDEISVVGRLSLQVCSLDF